MKVKERRTSTLKYTVLKPTQMITSIKRNFDKPHPGCPYELAQGTHATIRRYKKNIDSLEKVIPAYQWRHQSSSPIPRCLYVQLAPPVPGSKSISIDIYVEDLEVCLGKLSKLLFPQAIYLLLKAIEGYKCLWERFNKVTVDEETIGLTSNGQCISWINSSIDKNCCEEYYLQKPNEILTEIISLIRSKSQPVCQALLTKLMDKMSQKVIDFQEALKQVQSLAFFHRIKIPQNLRYLVNQHKLTKNFQDFKTQRSIFQTEQINSLKTPRFVASRTSLRQPYIFLPKNVNQTIANRPLSDLRKTTSKQLPFLTYKTINNNQIDGNCTVDDVNQCSHQNTRKKLCDSSVSKQKNTLGVHSRTKSQSYECILLGSSEMARREFENMSFNAAQKSAKRCSGFSDNTKAGSQINNSKMSKDFLNLQTAKKLNSGISNKNSSSIYDNKLAECKQYQSYECSPFNYESQGKNLSIEVRSPLQSMDPTFHLIPDPHEVIKANNWKTTLRNLFQVGSNMNSSITEGRDVNNYLYDVKLEKLDNIVNQIGSSIKTISSEN